MAEWEAEIRIRRNGRLVYREAALGDAPDAALYAAHNDTERWAEDHPESSRTVASDDIISHRAASGSVATVVGESASRVAVPQPGSPLRIRGRSELPDLDA